MIVSPATVPRQDRAGGPAALLLSDAGGLTQFGVRLETLAPGAGTGERHWHSAEDEFLYVVAGRVSVIDGTGTHDLGPGDAACWRAGVPNPHCLRNRTDAPCRYIIAGARVAHDICTYPDSGRRLVNHDRTWEILDAAGTRLRGGDLPAHLSDLAPDWAAPAVSPWPHPSVIRAAAARTETASPAQEAQLGAFSARLHSDSGGLAQFGAFTETLAPGARSSHRHWHEAEDEFLFVLDGTPTVVENDGPHLLSPGDAACWPAGVPNAHHVANRSPHPCTCLVIGTRLPSDTVHYADIDRLYTRVNGVVSRTRRDGSPLPEN